MERAELVGFLLRVDDTAVSVHRTLDDAQEAARRYGEANVLTIHTTDGALRVWQYDRANNAWLQTKDQTDAYDSGGR